MLRYLSVSFIPAGDLFARPKVKSRNCFHQKSWSASPIPLRLWRSAPVCKPYRHIGPFDVEPLVKHSFKAHQIQQVSRCTETLSDVASQPAWGALCWSDQLQKQPHAPQFWQMFGLPSKATSLGSLSPYFSFSLLVASSANWIHLSFQRETFFVFSTSANQLFLLHHKEWSLVLSWDCSSRHKLRGRKLYRSTLPDDRLTSSSETPSSTHICTSFNC